MHPQQNHPFDRYSQFTDIRVLKDISNTPLRKSLRVNTLKTTVEEFKKWGAEQGWQLEPVLWCNEAFYIDREDRSKALGKDLLHLLGHVYMQEAASMLPVELLDPQPGETILDMSAAPGSKTTQIAAKMKNSGVIIANDVQEKRLWTLKSALYRSGVLNTIVTKKVGQWFAKNMSERFDRVLCDAPCTAQGTARKDSDALMYCSLENIGKMARLQKELLESAVHATKIGGRIVYSTCTLTPEENEMVVREIVNKFSDQLEVVDLSRGLGSRDLGLGKAIEESMIVQKHLPNLQSPVPNPQPLIRLWPQTYDTEGFFCAVIHKKASTRPREKTESVRFQEEEMPKARAAEVGKKLEEQFGSSFMHDDERLFARTDQLLLATQSVAEFRLPVLDYSLGLPFAKKLDGNRFRLNQEIVSYRGKEATKSVYEISDEILKDLLDGKDSTIPEEFYGDIILLYKSLPIGTGLAQEGKLKNRLPRWIVQKS